MRYHELITEGLPPFLDPSNELFYKPEQAKIIEGIKENCKPYLEAISYEADRYLLYRGMNINAAGESSIKIQTSTSKLGLKDVRTTGRDPMSSYKADHDLLNQYFNEQYGHPYRNGLFVTGNMNEAHDYGNPYVIFPVGNYEFIVSDYISDLFVHILDPINSTAYRNWKAFAKDQEALPDNQKDDDIHDAVEEFRATSKPTDLLDFLPRYDTSQNIKYAMQTQHEIMIWTKQYYYILPDLVSKIDWRS